MQLIVARGDPLGAFLQDSMNRPFMWGELEYPDCLQWLSRWSMMQWGVDPGAQWREKYHDLKGAMRLVREAGGMAEHVERCVTPLGLRRTSAPVRGDIAVVRLPMENPKRDPFGGCLGAIVLAPPADDSSGTAAILMPPKKLPEGAAIAVEGEIGGIGIFKLSVTPIVAAWSL